MLIFCHDHRKQIISSRILLAWKKNQCTIQRTPSDPAANAKAFLANPIAAC
jgi:hypothetical protein